MYAINDHHCASVVATMMDNHDPVRNTADELMALKRV
jgi:hypothetical protein